MPYALDPGKAAATVIESRGVRHTSATRSMRCGRCRSSPTTRSHARERPAPRSRCSGRFQHSSQLVWARGRFLQIALRLALLNPHASIQFAWPDEQVIWPCYPALVPEWTKWGPSDPTSAHWYDAARFERLVAAYASQHGARTVREFVTEFRGLSSSDKVSQVLQASGLARTTMADLFDRNGKPDPSIRRLLHEMQERSKPVKPPDLGVIGREHFLSRFEQAGGDPDTFEYRCVRRLDDGVPTVIEVAFAYAPRVWAAGTPHGRELVPGDHQPVPAARQPRREPGARARRAVSPNRTIRS